MIKELLGDMDGLGKLTVTMDAGYRYSVCYRKVCPFLQTKHGNTADTQSWFCSHFVYKLPAKNGACNAVNNFRLPKETVGPVSIPIPTVKVQLPLRHPDAEPVFINIANDFEDEEAN